MYTIRHIWQTASVCHTSLANFALACSKSALLVRLISETLDVNELPLTILRKVINIDLLYMFLLFFFYDVYVQRIIKCEICNFNK